MGVLTRSASSTTYVRAKVKATESGSVVNPTADTVQMAFTTGGATPGASDWKAASWDTDSSTTPATYRAQCLIGSGGVVTLAVGLYTMWVRIQDSPEDVQEPSGLLRIV